MPIKNIDLLLEKSFQKEQNYRCLDGLQSDVWTKIRQRKVAVNTISIMLPVWSNIQLRYASLATALVIGLVVPHISYQPQSQTQTLGLEVFSPDASFLMTSLYKEI